MVCDKNDFNISASVTLSFNLLTRKLLTAHPFTPNVGKLSSKFEPCMLFRCRVDDGHGTDRHMDGM